MAAKSTTSELDEKLERSSLSNSSITLPAEAHMDSTQNGSTDLERAVTEKSHHLKSEEPATRYTTALDWEGHYDPENPENWSFGKKAFHILYIGLQCFIVTFGTSVYSPSIPQVARHFDVSIEAATLGITVYTLGLAFGPMISAPISETFGRKMVYLILFPISLLFTLGAGLANSFGTLLVCRFLAGLIGSGGLAVGAGSNSDMLPPLIRAPVASVFILCPFLGPSLGPMVGGYIAQYKTWRWTQWVLLMMGVVAVILGFFQKETYKKIILLKRAKRLGLPPPPNPIAAMSPLQRIKFILTVTLARPMVMLVTEPIVSFLAIYTAFNFGVLFCFFAAFPLVFQSIYPEIQVYHFSTGSTGLVYIAIGIGVMSASIIFIIIDRLYYVPNARKEIAAGKNERSLLLPPEERVHAAMIGSILLPVGLFWFAWTARSDIHWIVPIIATVFFGTGNLLVFFTAVLYQIDAYGPLMGASAMAANGILRYVAGAVFPLFTRQMYRAMGVGWATTTLGFVTVALMPLPWVLLKFGHRIRGKSKYAEFSKSQGF